MEVRAPGQLSASIAYRTITFFSVQTICSALQSSLPYDPETNLWKRGPQGSMYHSPPAAGGGGGDFAGSLKRKARGMSPLSDTSGE